MPVKISTPTFEKVPIGQQGIEGDLFEESPLALFQGGVEKYWNLNLTALRIPSDAPEILRLPKVIN